MEPRGARAAAPLLLLGFAASCGGTDAIDVVLPSDRTAGAKSAIVAIEELIGDSSRVLQGAAFDLDRPAAIPELRLTGLSEDVALRVTVFLLERPLIEAGLAPGAIGETIDGAPIPTAGVRALELTVGGGWIESARRSDALGAVKAPRAPSPCPAPEPRVIPLPFPVPTRIPAILPLDDAHVLALIELAGATSADVAAIVSSDGELEVLSIRGTRRLELGGGAVGPSGELYVSGLAEPGAPPHTRGIWRARVSPERDALLLEPVETATTTLELTTLARTASRSDVRWMTPPRPAELFALSIPYAVPTDPSVFERWDGQRWLEIHRFAPPGSTQTSAFFGALVEVPGGAFAMKPNEPRLIGWRDGRRVQLDLPADARGGPFAAHHGAMGLVVATAVGELYVSHDDDRLTLLGDSGFELPVHVIAAWRDGLVLGGNGGKLSVYTPAIGFCEPHRLASGDIHALATAGDVIFAGGSTPVGSTTGSILITRFRFR